MPNSSIVHRLLAYSASGILAGLKGVSENWRHAESLRSRPHRVDGRQSAESLYSATRSLREHIAGKLDVRYHNRILRLCSDVEDLVKDIEKSGWMISEDALHCIHILSVKIGYCVSCPVDQIVRHYVVEMENLITQIDERR